MTVATWLTVEGVADWLGVDAAVALFGLGAERDAARQLFADFLESFDNAPAN